MAKSYTIPQFKQAFKKPPRPKTVKSKEKDLLEKSVRDNNSASFGKSAKELFDKEPEYFVKLLRYKLGKHWKAGKRDMWLNEAPPEAVEQVFLSRDDDVVDGLTTSKQWTAVLNIESVTSGPHVDGDDSGDRLRKALASLSPDDLTTCFTAFQTRNDPQGVNFVPFDKLFQHLEMKNLLQCGKAFFDKQDKQPPIDWTGLDDLGATDDLAELSRQAERVNELYEQTYSGLKDDAQTLGNLWGGKVSARLYEKRDELIRDKKKAKEVFGVGNQFTRQLERSGIDGLDEEAARQIALVKSRLRAFGEETIVFDGSVFKNDCGVFARKLLAKLKRDERVATTSAQTAIAELDKFKAEFRGKFDAAGGVVMLKVSYNAAEAMCPYHFRTVVGRIGDKYVTYEANIGKKCLLAPEVMILTLDELLCSNDGDAVHRTGFSVESMSEESIRVIPPIED